MDTLPLHLPAADPFDDDPRWPPEVAMFDALNAYLQPTSTLTAHETAAAFDAQAPWKRAGAGTREAPESFAAELWPLVCRTAAQIPAGHAAHDRLLDFVCALRQLPPGPEAGGERFWADLPALGEWAYDLRRQIEADAGAPAERREAWASFCAFAGRLMRAGLLDCAAVCAAPFVGLEDAPDARALAHHQQGPVLDFGVRLLSQWLALAGNEVYVFCRERKRMGEQCALGRLVRALPEEQRFPADCWSLERWAFWMRRLDEIADSELPSPETRRLAVQARELMARIDADGDAVHQARHASYLHTLY